MSSTTTTAEDRWCGALRDELQLMASSFELDLNELDENFQLRLRQFDGEQGASDLVARIAKQNAADSLSGLEATARFLEAAAIPAAEAEPRGQPAHVHQLATLLMKPFRLCAGTIHVAGCVMDRRPFLRLTLLQQSVEDSMLKHRWYGPDGKQLSTEDVARLGLHDLKPLQRRLRGGDAESVRSWIHNDVAVGVGPVLAVIAWCNWISGKLRLGFADRSVYVPFEGWAMEFASGQRQVPRYRCPHTGEQGYELLMLEDGTITVASATGHCEATGRQVLRSQLRRCAITGMTCATTELTRCPISGELGLTSQLELCQWCGRGVLPQCAPGGRCDECVDLRAVVTGDAVDKALAPVADQVEPWGRKRGRILGDLVLLTGRQRLRERMLVLDSGRGKVVRSGWRRLPWGAWQIEQQPL